MDNEIWKPVPGYEGYYQVSSLGRVKRIKGGKGTVSGSILKNSITNCGYFNVGLSVNSKLKIVGVHRLVAEAFIPNPDNKPEVNHINGDKQDNRIVNLEWSTRSENIQHAWMTGLIKGRTDKHHTEESRNKISEALKGKHCAHYTEEIRKKISEAKKGNKNVKDRIWVNNGTENHRVKPDKLQEYLNKGYVLGRIKAA